MITKSTIIKPFYSFLLLFGLVLTSVEAASVNDNYINDNNYNQPNKAYHDYWLSIRRTNDVTLPSHTMYNVCTSLMTNTKQGYRLFLGVQGGFVLALDPNDISSYRDLPHVYRQEKVCALAFSELNGYLVSGGLKNNNVTLGLFHVDDKEIKYPSENPKILFEYKVKVSKNFITDLDCIVCHQPRYMVMNKTGKLLFLVTQKDNGKEVSVWRCHWGSYFSNLQKGKAPERLNCFIYEEKITALVFNHDMNRLVFATADSKMHILQVYETKKKMLDKLKNDQPDFSVEKSRVIELEKGIIIHDMFFSHQGQWLFMAGGYNKDAEAILLKFLFSRYLNEKSKDKFDDQKDNDDDDDDVPPIAYNNMPKKPKVKPMGLMDYMEVYQLNNNGAFKHVVVTLDDSAVVASFDDKTALMCPTDSITDTENSKVYNLSNKGRVIGLATDKKSFMIITRLDIHRFSMPYSSFRLVARSKRAMPFEVRNMTIAKDSVSMQKKLLFSSGKLFGKAILVPMKNGLMPKEISLGGLKRTVRFILVTPAGDSYIVSGQSMKVKLASKQNMFSPMLDYEKFSAPISAIVNIDNFYKNNVVCFSDLHGNLIMYNHKSSTISDNGNNDKDDEKKDDDAMDEYDESVNLPRFGFKEDKTKKEKIKDALTNKVNNLKESRKNNKDKKNKKKAAKVSGESVKKQNKEIEKKNVNPIYSLWHRKVLHTAKKNKQEYIHYIYTGGLGKINLYILKDDGKFDYKGSVSTDKDKSQNIYCMKGYEAYPYLFVGKSNGLIICEFYNKGKLRRRDDLVFNGWENGSVNAIVLTPKKELLAFGKGGVKKWDLSALLNGNKNINLNASDILTCKTAEITTAVYDENTLFCGTKKGGFYVYKMIKSKEQSDLSTIPIKLSKSAKPVEFPNKIKIDYTKYKAKQYISLGEYDCHAIAFLDGMLYIGGDNGRVVSWDTNQFYKAKDAKKSKPIFASLFTKDDTKRITCLKVNTNRKIVAGLTESAITIWEPFSYRQDSYTIKSQEKNTQIAFTFNNKGNYLFVLDKKGKLVHWNISNLNKPRYVYGYSNDDSFQGADGYFLDYDDKHKLLYCFSSSGDGLIFLFAEDDRNNTIIPQDRVMIPLAKNRTITTMTIHVERREVCLATDKGIFKHFAIDGASSNQNNNDDKKEKQIKFEAIIYSDQKVYVAPTCDTNKVMILSNRSDSHLAIYDLVNEEIMAFTASGKVKKMNNKGLIAVNENESNKKKKLTEGDKVKYAVAPYNDDDNPIFAIRKISNTWNTIEVWHSNGGSNNQGGSLKDKKKKKKKNKNRKEPSKDKDIDNALVI